MSQGSQSLEFTLNGECVTIAGFSANTTLLE